MFGDNSQSAFWLTFRVRIPDGSILFGIAVIGEHAAQLIWLSVACVHFVTLSYFVLRILSFPLSLLYPQYEIRNTHYASRFKNGAPNDYQIYLCDGRCR